MKKFLLCVSMAALFVACSYQPSTNNIGSADSTAVDSTMVQPIDTTAVTVVDTISTNTSMAK